MKQFCFPVLALALFLAACSDESAKPAKEAELAPQTETLTETMTKVEDAPAYTDGYILNPQVTDDRALQTAGQRFRDDKGQAELKAAHAKSETYAIGKIELTIHDAKLFHYQPSYGLIDFYHSYTHEEEFDVLKAFVEIRNLSDETLKFAPAALIKTSAGEEMTWEDDIYLEELNGEIKAGETKKGNIGVIVEKAEIESATITTSDVFDGNDKKVESAEEIEVEFKK